MSVIFEVMLCAPSLSCLMKEPFQRCRPDTLSGLSDGTARKEFFSGLAIGTEAQTADNVSDRLFAKEGHTYHHPDNHVSREVSPTDSGMFRESQAVL